MSAQAASTTFLKSKFQIGSANGRVQYQPEEQVFHSSDITLKAKEAKTYIREFKKSNKLQHVHPNVPWNPNCTPGLGRYDCGVRPAPWDSDKFEDRYYAEKETERALQERRIYKHNAINDVDTNTKAIQPHWNVSTHFYDPFHSKQLREQVNLAGYTEVHRVRALTAPPPKNRVTYTGSTTLGTGQPRVMHLDEVARQRANKFQPRRTVQPSDTRSLYTRSRIDLQSVRKEKAARRAEQEARVARVDPIFNMTLEDFPTDFGNLQKYVRPPAEETKEQLENTYTTDMLTEYLAVNSNKNYDNFPTKKRNKNAKQTDLVKLYEHRGSWEYSAVEECDVWSCCMNTEKDSQGCSSRTIVNKKKLSV